MTRSGIDKRRQSFVHRACGRVVTLRHIVEALFNIKGIGLRGVIQIITLEQKATIGNKQRCPLTTWTSKILKHAGNRCQLVWFRLKRNQQPTSNMSTLRHSAPSLTRSKSDAWFTLHREQRHDRSHHELHSLHVRFNSPRHSRRA